LALAAKASGYIFAAIKCFENVTKSFTDFATPPRSRKPPIIPRNLTG
jgi:hypothetical protein